MLLNCPVDEWPAWLVKIHVVAGARELDPSATVAASQTVSSDEKSAVVSRLAALTYGLLGGDPKNFIPLAKLDWEATSVLRRGLSVNHGFSSATDFYQALNRARSPGSGPLRPAVPPVESSIPEMTPPAPLPVKEDVALSSPASPAPRRWLRVSAAIVAVALLGGAGMVWKSLQSRTQAAPVKALLPSPRSASNGAAVTLSPPQRGKPWTNTLDMSFVPVGDIHVAVFETRVRDFEAFVQATHYDAEGGMSSAMKQDGFARRNLSWKSPGFPQTPDDPVVGVCWEDADQFCAWLTKKERGEGAITAFQRYRLPTDREWSEAVGLLHEEGATPGERSGRSKGVYPWGGTMAAAGRRRQLCGGRIPTGRASILERPERLSRFLSAHSAGRGDARKCPRPSWPRWQRLGVDNGPFQPVHQLARFAWRLMGDVPPGGNALVLSAWL